MKYAILWKRMVPSLQELAVVVHFTCVQFPWEYASSSRGKFLLQVYYVSNGVETLFRILSDKNTQNIDTFTLHGWIARDYDTGKQLFIGNKRTFYPPKGTSIRNRHRAYITVPREYHEFWSSPLLGGWLKSEWKRFQAFYRYYYKRKIPVITCSVNFREVKHRRLWAADDNQKWNVSLFCFSPRSGKLLIWCPVAYTNTGVVTSVKVKRETSNFRLLPVANERLC